jgi:hypothetical protein
LLFCRPVLGPFNPDSQPACELTLVQEQRPQTLVHVALGQPIPLLANVPSLSRNCIDIEVGHRPAAAGDPLCPIQKPRRQNPELQGPTGDWRFEQLTRELERVEWSQTELALRAKLSVPRLSALKLFWTRYFSREARKIAASPRSCRVSVSRTERGQALGATGECRQIRLGAHFDRTKPIFLWVDQRMLAQQRHLQPWRAVLTERTQFIGNEPERSAPNLASPPIFFQNIPVFGK